MRETITFPRARPRPLASVLLCALLGAFLLVLALPGPIHERGGSTRIRPAGGMAVGQLRLPEQPLADVGRARPTSNVERAARAP